MNAFVNQITRVAGWTQWRSHSYTIFFLIFVVKRKEWYVGDYFKQITQIMPWYVRGILAALVLVVNANIDSFV